MHLDHPSHGYRKLSADDDVDSQPRSPNLDDLEDPPSPKATSFGHIKHRNFAVASVNNTCDPKLRDLDIKKAQLRSVIPRPLHLHSAAAVSTRTHYETISGLQNWLNTCPDNMRKRKYAGFDPQELLLNGALHCSPCRTNDLVYAPKLNIFREERFLDTPEDVLNVLKPSLALAELIILKGNPRFWVDLACGARVVDNKASEAVGGRAEKLLALKIISDTNISTTVTKLQKLGDCLIYRFADLNDFFGVAQHTNVAPSRDYCRDSLGQGVPWPTSNRLNSLDPASADPWKGKATITLNHHLATSAKIFANQRYRDEAALLRFNFFFAVNLLHELSHMFDFKCGGGHYYDEICRDRALAATRGEMAPSYLPRRAEAQYKKYKFR